MKITKKKIELKDCLNEEWVLSNGIGGFCSTTVIGANTRRYHGLLVAPLNAPGERRLILSKLDESVEIKGNKYDLYTNIGKEYISQGYKYQESFSKDILPIFKYKVKDMTISKTICMVYGKNTVEVFYKVRNGKQKAKITLAPIVNYRDFHSMNTDHDFDLEQHVDGNKVRLVIDGKIHSPIFMKTTEGKYIEHNNDIFYNMLYIEEEKRGFYPIENHIVSGRFEIEVEPNEEKEFAFICSLEENIDELDPKEVINNEIIRQNELYNQSLMIDNKNQNKTKKEDEKIKMLINKSRASKNMDDTYKSHSDENDGDYIY